MQHSKPQQLHCNQNGRSLAGWYTSRPHPRARVYHTDVKATATARDPVSAVDLIQWPEGTRPKRGGVTKHSLTRLKVCTALTCHATVHRSSPGGLEVFSMTYVTYISCEASMFRFMASGVRQVL